MSRVKLLSRFDVDKANQEFGMLIADLLTRGVKHHTINHITLDREELKHAKSLYTLHSC